MRRWNNLLSYLRVRNKVLAFEYLLHGHECESLPHGDLDLPVAQGADLACRSDLHGRRLWRYLSRRYEQADVYH